MGQEWEQREQEEDDKYLKTGKKADLGELEKRFH